MKILYLATSYGSRGGGIGRVNATLVDYLKKRAEVTDLSVLVLQAPFSRQRVGSGIRVLSYGGSRARFVAGVILESLRGYDLVVCDHIQLAQIAGVWPLPLGGRMAVFLHGIEVWTRLSRLKRMGVARADLLLANSRHTAERAVAVNPGLRNIRVCQLGVPALLGGWGLKGEHFPLEVPEPFVLLVGRMASSERYKGHDRLISALTIISRSVPNTSLVFVGSGDDVPRLKRRAKDAQMADRVKFAGFVSDEALQAYYSRCSVFAMPSTGEGFGLAYVEAMQHGKPCIGALGSSAAEIIEHGETGLLVDPSDTCELAATLDVLLTDDALRGRMGDAARERYLRYFTAEAFGQRVWANVVNACGSDSRECVG